MISNSIETMNDKEEEMKSEFFSASASISITSEMVSGGDEVTTGADEVHEVPGLEGTQADVIEEWITTTVEKGRVSKARTFEMSCFRTANQ